jgi:WD40 repeat protein
VPIREFNHGGPVFSVAVNRDGTVIVSGSADQTVRVWDAKTGGPRAQLSGHQGAVYGLALSRDESLAVSSGNDNTLRLWDIQGGRQLKQLATTEATAYALAVHPVASILATGGADRRVHLYDLLTGDRQRTCVGHPDYIHSVVFDPQGARVLSYGYAGHLIVWKTDDGTKLFETRIGRVGNTARYSPDGSRVVLANGDGTARIIELPAQAR